MNIKRKIPLIIKTSLFFIISLLSINSSAQGSADKDLEFVITVDPITHCATAVTPIVNEQNCKKEYIESKNPCKNVAECVC